VIRVYVAGPVGKTDAGRSARLEAGESAGVSLIRSGLVPVIPHLYARLPGADDLLSYEGWMALCFCLLDSCEWLVRIPGESPGADREVARARAQGKPVFFGVEQAVRALALLRGGKP